MDNILDGTCQPDHKPCVYKIYYIVLTTPGGIDPSQKNRAASLRGGTTSVLGSFRGESVPDINRDE